MFFINLYTVLSVRHAVHSANATAAVEVKKIIS